MNQMYRMPLGYEQPQKTTAQPVTMPNSSPTQMFVWVNGLEDVERWPMAAGSSMFFMSMNDLVLYSRTVDLYGRSLPIEIYDMVKREPDPSEQYITKGEIEEMFKKYLGGKGNTYYKASKKKESESEE